MRIIRDVPERSRNRGASGKLCNSSPVVKERGTRSEDGQSGNHSLFAKCPNEGQKLTDHEHTLTAVRFFTERQNNRIWTTDWHRVCGIMVDLRVVRTAGRDGLGRGRITERIHYPREGDCWGGGSDKGFSSIHRGRSPILGNGCIAESWQKVRSGYPKRPVHLKAFRLPREMDVKNVSFVNGSFCPLRCPDYRVPDPRSCEPCALVAGTTGIDSSRKYFRRFCETGNHGRGAAARADRPKTKKRLPVHVPWEVCRRTSGCGGKEGNSKSTGRLSIAAVDGDCIAVHGPTAGVQGRKAGKPLHRGGQHTNA